MTERYEDGFDRFFAERDAREAELSRKAGRLTRAGKTRTGFARLPRSRQWDKDACGSAASHGQGALVEARYFLTVT